MNLYQEQIMSVTGCSKEEVEQVEDIMRHDILHSTLDWLNKHQFDAAAKEAYKVFLILKEAPTKSFLLVDDALSQY